MSLQVLRCLVGAALVAVQCTAQPLFPDVVIYVPGRPPSTHFTAELFYNGSWQSVYVFESVAKAEARTPYSNGYFGHLANWTASWVSSQILPGQDQVMLRVRRADGPAIASAAVHPASAHVQILNISSADGVTLAVDHPARVVIDFDGTLDATDTGPSFSGPPRHTFCWFIDAQVALPDPAAPGTVVVRPGDPWPTALNPLAWQTVILAPGVHRFLPAPPFNWTVLNLTAQTRYFLCAGAVVHAAFHGGAGAWGQNGVTVDGFGILSGEEMTRDTSTSDNESPQGVVFSGLRNASLLGITLVDFPNHHVILGQFAGDRLQNVKVLGWRANGDGVHVFGSWNVSDLFLRTQDDSLYLDCGGGAAASFERITTWNDANGVAFLFSPGGGSIETGVTLHDSDAIYTRTSWYWWGPNTVFVQRGVTNGQVRGHCYFASPSDGRSRLFPWRPAGHVGSRGRRRARGGPAARLQPLPPGRLPERRLARAVVVLLPEHLLPEHRRGELLDYSAGVSVSCAPSARHSEYDLCGVRRVQHKRRILHQRYDCRPAYARANSRPDCVQPQRSRPLQRDGRRRAGCTPPLRQQAAVP